jgi:proteasome lid subunit RPN8/RPN11
MVQGTHQRNATIKEQAFVGMIASALEVYKKESFGLLIGEIHKKHYLIVDTYTYQAAQRKYESVGITPQKKNRINNSLRFFSSSRVIGDFHSHPEGPDFLSGCDKTDTLSGNTELTILVSVYKTKTRHKWRFNKDLSISGSVGNTYFIKIVAFEANKKEKRVNPIKIVCPYLTKINKLKLFEKRVY